MEIVLAILGSGALASVVSGIFSLINNRHKKETGISSGVRILLYDRIKYLCIHYIERECISTEEYEDLVNMHAVYHNDLNGNGFLDDLMDQIKNLPRYHNC